MCSTAIRSVRSFLRVLHLRPLGQSNIDDEADLPDLDDSVSAALAVGVTDVTFTQDSRTMAEPNPSLHVIEKVLLTGTMAVYASQAEASLRIPKQWKEFRSAHPSLGR